jgi:N-acylglucosamine-6-phosphate 2-epimerase
MASVNIENSPFSRLLLPLRNSLIVSCQARDNEPLNDPYILAEMAKAAVLGGAKGIRANKPANIRAIRRAVDVPIFGIFKQDYPDSPIYITPTLAEASAIVEAGCNILTVQATNQPRPNGEILADYLATLKRHFNLPIMADVSTLGEGVTAAELGADLIATTMSGYTSYSRQLPGPDLQLIQELSSAVSVPIIAEGRISTPHEARLALDMGAYAVVVGSMITRPQHITAYFIQGMNLNEER